MIAHGEGFIIRHRSGRYFRSHVHCDGFAAGTPSDLLPPVALIYDLTSNPFAADLVRAREWCGRFFTSDPAWSLVADQFDVVPRPGCGCCGSAYLKRADRTIWSDGDVHRCARHRDRNPCAIEGCLRTHAAPHGLGDDQWLCAEHWRAACPPRSALRRCYQRFFRLAKKMGWTPNLERRFKRFWDALIRRARSDRAGDLDMAEIERMFGWAA